MLRKIMSVFAIVLAVLGSGTVVAEPEEGVAKTEKNGTEEFSDEFSAHPC